MGVAQRKQDRRLEVFEDTYAMWTVGRQMPQPVAILRLRGEAPKINNLSNVFRTPQQVPLHHICDS